MKKIIFGLIVLFAVVGLWWYFVGSQEPDVPAFGLSSNDPNAEFVISADGKLFLEIPEDALPEDVKVSDVSIANISSQEFFGLNSDEDHPQNASVVAYRLLPDGTKFNKPVLVHIETEASDLAQGNFVIPNVLHSFLDENGEYILDVPLNTGVVFDTELGTAKVSGELMHFSNVAVDKRHGLFRAVYTPAEGEFVLNESFDFDLVITDITTSYMTGTAFGGDREPREVTVSVANGTVSHFNRGREFLVRSIGRLSPQEAERPHESVVTGREYLFTQSYTCVDKGQDSLAFVGGTLIDFTRQISVPEQNSQDVYIRRETASTNFSFVLNGPHYSCIEKVEPIEELEETENHLGDDLNFSPQDTNGSSQGSTGPGGNILMIRIGESYYPVSQFTVKAAGEPEPEHSCARPHYHAKRFQTVYGLAGEALREVSILQETDTTGCGYGIYDNLERIQLPLNLEQRSFLLEYIESL